MKERLERQLRWDSRVSPIDLRIEEREGKIVLSGAVESYAAKFAAEDIARSVVGVQEIDNRLDVLYRRPVSDRQLKENVERMLAWNPDIDEGQITVTASDGHVKLSGTVDAFWKKAFIEADTTNMIGVVEITNSLAVVPHAEIVDESIKQQIIERLEKEIGTDRIGVEVEEGEVVLSGTAQSWMAKRSALDIAEQSGGVRYIYDNIEVAA